MHTSRRIAVCAATVLLVDCLISLANPTMTQGPAMTMPASTATAPADRLVLEGVPKIGFGVRMSPFPGSVEAVMKYLDEPVDYDTLMVVSGASFRRTFNKDDGGNVDLLYFSPEPQRRVFDALGFAYRAVSWTDKDKMIAAIKESLAAGRPVIACGIVGPPEAGIVAGYDHGGATLLGHSYFPPGKKGNDYFVRTDWYAQCTKDLGIWTDVPGRRQETPGLIVLGQRKPRPSARQQLVAALAWAVDLARVSRRSHLPDHVCGLAAYDAFAVALEVDADYPKDNPRVLETRAMVYSDQMMMLADRRHAAGYLRAAARAFPEAAEDLLAAAESLPDFERVPGLWPWKSHFYQDAEVQQGLADPQLRRALAAKVRQCAALESRAVDHLEKALAILSPLPSDDELDVPAPEALTRGARWQVENIPASIALRAAMNVLGDDLSREVKDGWATDHAYDLSMVASGAAFGNCLSIRKNSSVLDEQVRQRASTEEDQYQRMLEILGRSGEILIYPQPPGTAPAVVPATQPVVAEAALRQRILSALSRDGTPVILQGVPKPGHFAVITSYEKSGEVLGGWSCEGGGPSILFDPEKRETYRDWYPKLEAAVILKSRIATDQTHAHRRMLAHGIACLRETEQDGYLAGGPLYEAWAKMLEADFAGDQAAAVKHYNRFIDPYIWDLAERRHYVRVVLDLIAPRYPAAAEELSAAAGECVAIHDLMWKINRTGGAKSPGEVLPDIADAGVRKQIAAMIRACRDHDTKAADHMEKALRRIIPGPATRPAMQ